MELLIGLVALIVIGYFLFFYKKPEEVQSTPAPYKVEEPVKEEVQPVVEAKVDPVSVALDLEPMALSATEAPAKKPRKPRAPKVEAKPVAKKAVAKKPAVKKPAARSVVRSKKA